jgi:hypothetical protein
VGHRVPDHVALEAGLLGAAGADLDHRLQAGGSPLGVVEAVVGVVDVRLLSRQFRVRRH